MSDELAVKKESWPQPLGVCHYNGLEFTATVEPGPGHNGPNAESWKFVLFGANGDRHEQVVAGFHKGKQPPPKEGEPPWGKAWKFAWHVIMMQIDGRIPRGHPEEEEGEEWKKGKRPD